MLSAVAKKIKQARLAAGLKQSELAYRVGISTQLVSAFESGRIKPATKYLEKIAQHTHKPLYFFTGQKVAEAIMRIDELVAELSEIRNLLSEVREDNKD